MTEPEIYQSHLLLPQPDGTVSQHLGGRFMIHDGQLDHLAVYHDGQQAQALPAGPVTPATMETIAKPPAGMLVGSRKGIEAGEHLDMLPEHPLEKPYQPPAPPPQPLVPPRPASVFHYRRVGHDRPHVLEVVNGQHLLDGNPLSRQEVEKILENLQNGSASLRYRTGETAAAVHKAELLFRGLRKTGEEEDEMDPTSVALSHLGKLSSDPKTQESLKVLRRQIYEDPMMEGLGNRYAWDQFSKKNMPGVYGSLDLNDLKATNDTHGHAAGDALIRGFGRSAREAADEAAPGHIKLFRVGGDEVNMHATSPEHAYSFLRTLREKLDQIPPINGTHRISMSAGLGPDYATADKALYLAKGRKQGPMGTRVYQPGQTPHLVHSLMPGSEGPIPHDYAVPQPAIAAPPPDVLVAPHSGSSTPTPPASSSAPATSQPTAKK